MPSLYFASPREYVIRKIARLYVWVSLHLSCALQANREHTDPHLVCNPNTLNKYNRPNCLIQMD